MLRTVLKLISLSASLVVLAPLAGLGWALTLLPRRAERTPGGRRTLVVTPFRPGEESGGARAVLELQHSLQGRGADVTVVALSDVAQRGGLSGVLSRWLSRALPLPPSCRAILLRGPDLTAALAATDIVVFEFFASALTLFMRRRPARHTVLRDHEVLLRKLAIERATATGLNALDLTLRIGICYLISLVVYAKADRIVALTDEDADSLRRSFPSHCARIVSIPVSFRMPALKPPGPLAPQVRDLVMVGNFFHGPNVDALRWFLSECAPHLDAGFALHIFGIDGPLDALDLSAVPLRVIRNGFVADLEAALPVAAIAVSPVVSGGGVRMKNLLFASLALPVVTTALGNEGIGLTDGREAIVTSDGREMARRINVLARTPVDAAAMGLSGRTFVATQFGAERTGNHLMAELFPDWIDGKSA